MNRFFPKDLKPLTEAEELEYKSCGKCFRYRTDDGELIYYIYNGKMLVTDYHPKENT